MTLDEMLKQVNDINAKIAEKNAIRNQSIGKRDTLAEKFSTMVEEYKGKYGVDLSSREAMDAEISKVLAEKEEETSILSQALSLIESNKFVDAERLLTGTTETEEEIKRFALEREQKEQQAKEEAKEERAEVRETEKEIKAGNVTVATPEVQMPDVPVAMPSTPTPAPVQPTEPVQPAEPVSVSIADELREIFDTTPKVIPNQNQSVTEIPSVPNAPTAPAMPTAPTMPTAVPDVPNASSNAPTSIASETPSSPTASVVNEMFNSAVESASSPILSGVDEFMSSIGMAQPSTPTMPSTPPVSQPMAQPSAPSAPTPAEKPKSFDAIFGGTAFKAGV